MYAKLVLYDDVIYASMIKVCVCCGVCYTYYTMLYWYMVISCIHTEYV